jgi:hypothetical protein
MSEELLKQALNSYLPDKLNESTDQLLSDLLNIRERWNAAVNLHGLGSPEASEDERNLKIHRIALACRIEDTLIAQAKAAEPSQQVSYQDIEYQDKFYRLQDIKFSDFSTSIQENDIVTIHNGDIIHHVKVSNVYSEFLNGTVVSDTTTEDPGSQMRKGGFPRVYLIEIRAVYRERSL